HTPRANLCVRRNAIIRLTIPSREIQSLDVWGGEGERFLKGARPLAIARDMNEHGGARPPRNGERAREIREDEGVIAVGRRQQSSAFVSELLNVFNTRLGVSALGSFSGGHRGKGP